jgi:hypothetical protein
MKNFYLKLQLLFEKYDYPPHRIWNCDENGVQACQNGKTYVLVKHGCCSVCQVIFDEHEWMTVLALINTSGESVPNFYISMAMNKKAWIISFLFATWLNHLILDLQNLRDISTSCFHIFIMDGHNLHVLIEVVKKARSVGLHLLTLPSHSNHAKQPLNILVFMPFKISFLP